VTKEAGSTTDTSKAHSNKRDRKNKYSSGQKPPVRARRQRRRNKKKSLCNRCRQRKKLL